MHLKIFLSVLFILLMGYLAIRYSESTQEAAQTTSTYMKIGIKATKDSRDMIDGSKEMMKEREKVGDFDEQ